MIVSFSLVRNQWKAMYAGYGSKMTIICKKFIKKWEEKILQDSDTGWK